MNTTIERCEIQGCTRPTLARNMCGMHYQRWSKTGDPGEAKPRYQQKPDICTVDGCSTPAEAKGYCLMHYKRWRNTGDPGLAEKRLKRITGPCTFPDCGKPSYVRGLCSGHNRQARDGKELRPLRSISPPGSGTIKDGYRCISNGSGKWRFEHRLIMAGVLGRELFSNENVHHINGDKLNNSPTNLELWITSQPSGQRVPDLLAWAHEIIARYECFTN